jgi:hypothetical protein
MMMVYSRRLLATLVTAVVTAAGILAAAPPAAAADARWRITRDGNFSCFGKPGKFKPGTRVLQGDWNGNGLKEMCIGVAPDRSIWYIQPTSADWKEIPPGNGAADDMVDWLMVNGSWRYIFVRVGSEQYMTYWNDDGWYGGWIHCASCD